MKFHKLGFLNITGCEIVSLFYPPLKCNNLIKGKTL
jgi:hypothetical protein